ncbi:MAG: MerR family transcriptional regulator [Nanoarchaeota archaeon]
MRPDKISYSPKDLTSIVDIKYRQIQYWDKTGFLKPSHKRNGRYRSYSFDDVLEAKLLHKLRDEYGISVQQLRKIAPNLRTELANISGDHLDLQVVIPNVRAKDPIILTSHGTINRSWPGGKDFFAYSANDLVKHINSNTGLSTKTQDELSLLVEEP